MSEQYMLNCPYYAKACRKWPDECQRCEDEELKDAEPPMTNGDKLRQLDDNELAKALDRLAQNVINGNYCEMLGMEGNEKPSCFDKDDNSGCIECALKWLRSPSGEQP